MNTFVQQPISKKIPGIILGIFSLVLLISSFQIRANDNKEIRLLIAPPPYMKHITAGYQEAVADVMWIRTIQDLDFCDKPEAQSRCRNNSWLYKMIDTITELSPRFRMPYAAGSLALTVIITDIDGATKIFEKGIAAFPTDWPILYRAAYHYLYEVGDKKRAADLLIRAGKSGGPPFVFALAGRLYSDSGYVDLAESLLEQMIAEKQEEQFIKRLRDKIAQIKSESKPNKASQ